MRDISKNIKQLRIQKGMTQDELAEMLFVTRQTVSNYEVGKSRPDVDMLINIAAALDTDVNTVIYGVPVDEGNRRRCIKIIIAAVIPVLIIVLSAVLLKTGKEIMMYTFDSRLAQTCLFILRPLAVFIAGWCVMYILGQVLKIKPIIKSWTKWARLGLFIICLFFVLYSGLYLVDIIGVRLNIGIDNYPGLTAFHVRILLVFYDMPWIFPILGAALWIFGFPKKKDVSE